MLFAAHAARDELCPEDLATTVTPRHSVDAPTAVRIGTRCATDRQRAAAPPSRCRRSCRLRAGAGQRQLRIGYQKAASLIVLQKAQGTLEKRLAPLGSA